MPPVPTKDNEQQPSEEFEYPRLTPEEEAAQRGTDSASVRPNHKPQEPRPEEDERERQRRAEIERMIEREQDKRGRVRQEGLWPYLLIRGYAGDHGVRPISSQPFWCSPDIIVVPGIVQTYDGLSATVTPRPGVAHTIFVHVWNLGHLPAIGVSLRVYWANPSFDFNNPATPPQQIGMEYINSLDDSNNPTCHRLVRLSAPWIPEFVNGGHECLLAKVSCFADGGGLGFDASSNRHVGQLNLNLLAPDSSMNLLLDRLLLALPRTADLHLLHGMGELTPLLQANQPLMAQQLRPPSELPNMAYRLKDGRGHLGAIMRSDEGFHYVPPEVAGPRYGTGGLERGLLANPAVRPIPVGLNPLQAMLGQLGAGLSGPPGCVSINIHLPTFLSRRRVGDSGAGSQATLGQPGGWPLGLTARDLARKLGTRPGEGHLLHFVATDKDQVVGGYSIIVTI